MIVPILFITLQHYAWKNRQYLPEETNLFINKLIQYINSNCQTHYRTLTIYKQHMNNI